MEDDDFSNASSEAGVAKHVVEKDGNGGRAEDDVAKDEIVVDVEGPFAAVTVDESVPDLVGCSTSSSFACSGCSMACNGIDEDP